MFTFKQPVQDLIKNFAKKFSSINLFFLFPIVLQPDGVSI